MNVFSKRSLAIDADGTIVDFETKAFEVLGMSFAEHAAKYKIKATWREIRHYRCPETGHGFYESLAMMPDAMILMDGIRHIEPKSILTGCPFGDWAPPQKVANLGRHFPGIPVITCMAKDKPLYMKPGDVLIDDREIHRAGWEAAGGIWITHTSAESSLAQLRDLVPEWFDHT